MSSDDRLLAFSAHRLNGEPVPPDLRALLEHAEDLSDRASITLGEDGWAAWLDTSYLSKAELAEPRHRRQRAGDRGGLRPDRLRGGDRGRRIPRLLAGRTGLRPIAESPLVLLDNEGQFNLCRGTSLAEAILDLTYDEDQFADLRDWMRSLGIAIQAESPGRPRGAPRGPLTRQTALDATGDTRGRRTDV